MIQSNPRISEESAEFYKSRYKNLNNGVTVVLENFPAMYKITLHEIKGIFTENELCFIIDVAKSGSRVPAFNGMHLKTNCTDAATYYGLDKDLGVSIKALTRKIDKLSVFHRAVMGLWSASYWTNGKDQYNVFEWAKELA